MNENKINIFRQEQAVKNFMSNCLNRQNDEQKIFHILADLGNYYNADRTYIFEFNKECTNAEKICEWCRETNNIENNLIEEPELWLEKFREKGEFFISSLTENCGLNSKEYQILKSRGVDSIMSVPIIVNGITAAFLGVDNPCINTGDMLLLSVAASVCYNDIFAERKMELNLKKTYKGLTDQFKIIRSLSEIYTSVYYIDMATGLFSELSSFADVHKHIGASGNAQERLNYFCHNMMLPECTDDMLEFVDLSTLDQRLSHCKIVSKQYLSTIMLSSEQENRPQWTECCFIECERTPDGKLAYVIFATRTIHNQKIRELEAQRKLQETLSAVEKVNQILLEEMSISSALSQEYSSLFKVDAKTGKLSLYRTDGISINPTLLNKMLDECDNYESVLSKYIDTFVVPEDKERLRDYSRLAVLLDNVPDIGLYKLGYKRIMNGVISYYEMNIVKTVDNNGEITFIIGLRDVDGEMRRQLKQTKEMEMQREIIEGLGSEYYSVLLVNPKTDEVTNYRAEGDEGLAIAEYFQKHDNCWSKGIQGYAEELVSESSRSEFIEKLSLNYIRSNNKDYSITYEKITDDGIIYLQVRVSFVYEKDGGLVAVVGTRNMDDLIKKERQQETALRAAFDAAESASRAKTDFLSNMSHDIRTPLNGIIGMTAIAAAHINDKERVQDSLQKITQASKHLLSLINEVLDMSKIESGKVDLNEEEFRLPDLIDNLITMTSPQIEAHHHKLSVHISGLTHEAVIGDSLRIQKIFMNLMGNAVKFTPDGGKIRLSISEKPSAQAKFGCFEFVFEDNGIGMSEEFLDKVFDPFARAADERVNRIQGTGLGLAISRNIVRMMGGDIKVESKIGVGSRFVVTVYLKLQDIAETHYDKFIDLNVLVADDDAVSLETCCGMLNDLGMKAEGVFTGAEAVDRVVLRHRQKNDYFACIIDWKMPDMDGVATTKAIRKQVGKDVPIIIISAYDWSDIEHEARAAGANAFISKPLFRSRLEKTFSVLLGEDDEKEQEKPLVELGSMNLTGYRALLAEDNELNAEIATEILGMTGLDIKRAVDGKEAVDMMCECGDGYYDIIFMDIQMPNMNGYDATRAIRSMNSDYCKQIPIIAMTANAFAEDIQAAKTVGMNEHIAKPLDLNMLAKTLNKWICKKTSDS